MSEDFIENYVEEEDQGPTIIDLYREAAGKSVSLDYFLFSCLERKETLNAIQEGWDTDSKWPETDKEGAVEDRLSKLKGWAFTEHSNLSSNDPLDHEIIEPYVDSTLRLASEFEKYLSKAKPAAKELEAALSNVFGKQPFILRYLLWISTEAKIEKLDLSSVPPQGKYAYILKKQLQRSAPRRDSKPGGRNNTRGNSNRSSSTRSAPNRNSNNNSKRKEFDKDRPRKERPNNNSSRPRNNSKPQNHAGDEQKKEAVNEAKTAISRLKKETKLDEILLDPRNSFLRRLQHQYISDSGYTSNSVGEGRSRSIKVSRK